MSGAIFDDDAWLARDPLPALPMPVLERWLSEAFAAGVQPTPHAIALASIGDTGRPEVRMVLCKEIDAERGHVVFYTDQTSDKARALAGRPHAALVFHFTPPGRQARVSGAVHPVSAVASDAYFASRPRDSQLAAWASQQSQPLASRRALEQALAAVESRFGDGPIPRPPNWGGSAVVAERVELWRSRPARLHDRALWLRDSSSAAWTSQRLQP